METFSALLIPLWGESTGHRWIPLTKGSNAELWYLPLWRRRIQSLLAETVIKISVEFCFVVDLLLILVDPYNKFTPILEGRWSWGYCGHAAAQ